MRLSLMKGAHADLSSTAWQEIGVKPSFGFEWDAQDLTPPAVHFITKQCPCKLSPHDHQLIPNPPLL